MCPTKLPPPPPLPTLEMEVGREVCVGGGDTSQANYFGESPGYPAPGPQIM